VAAIRRFQDLRAWQRARELTHVIYTCSGSGRFSRDFGLRDQIRRAAVSVMSNIAEGFERGSPAEIARFLVIAKASVAEVETQLYVALDQRYITESEFREIRMLATSTKRLIRAFISYLRSATPSKHFPVRSRKSPQPGTKN
jgi:four helix bundle protein